MISRLGFAVQRFPVLTEVFVLTEVDAIADMGFEVSVFSSAPPSNGPLHEEAIRWLSRTHYPGSLVSPEVLHAHAYFVTHRTRQYAQLRARLPLIGIRGFKDSVYFAWVARKARIQHVHAHFAWAATTAQIIAQLLDIPFSFSLINTDIYGRPPANLEGLINEATFTVPISEYNRRYLMQTYKISAPERMHVIYHSTRPGRFCGSRDRGSGSLLRLLTVARLEPVKNISLLLQLCKELASKHRKFVCDIVGDGSERLALEGIASDLGLRAVIRFRGGLSHEQLVSLYEAADIFILTSVREGMPVSLMEAMAAEIPVVAPNIMGIPELVENGRSGFLFSPGDLAGAVRAVEHLLSDAALRAQMGRSGREKVERDCNIEHNAPKLIELIRRYDTILNTDRVHHNCVDPV